MIKNEAQVGKGKIMVLPSLAHSRRGGISYYFLCIRPKQNQSL